jgi:chromosome segregation ATPase
MRDISGDLQDRANLLEHQIAAAQGQFDKLIEQLSQEYDRRLANLKSELDAINAVIETEDRRLGKAPSVLKAQPQLRPSQPPQQAHLHPPFAASPIRKMSAVSGR